MFLLHYAFSFVFSIANFCITLKPLDDDQPFYVRNTTNTYGFWSFTYVRPDTDNCLVWEKMIFRIIGKNTTHRRSFDARTLVLPGTICKTTGANKLSTITLTRVLEFWFPGKNLFFRQVFRAAIVHWLR